MNNKKIYTVGLRGKKSEIECFIMYFKHKKTHSKGFTAIYRYQGEEIKLHIYTDQKFRKTDDWTLTASDSQKENHSNVKKVLNDIKKIVQAEQSSQAASSSIAEHGIFANAGRTTYHYHYEQKESARPFACNVM